jgi:purine nucleosidase
MEITIIKRIRPLIRWSLIGKTMIFLSATTLLSCAETPKAVGEPEEPKFRHHVIFDTDANNEIDDQHALAYLLFNGDVFAVEGSHCQCNKRPGTMELAAI